MYGLKSLVCFGGIEMCGLTDACATGIQIGFPSDCPRRKHYTLEGACVLVCPQE